MLSGKAGLVHVHMGAGRTMLQPLREALALSDVPIAQFWPTHMDRNERLLRDGLQWIKEGGYIDFTAGHQVCTCPCLGLGQTCACAMLLPYMCSSFVASHEYRWYL